MKPSGYAVIAALVLLAACSKITVENYDRLKAGMTFAEVKQLLGEPAKCDEAVGLRKCVWGDDARHITVSFVGDRVAVFAGKGIK
jgi:hypothetical protein